MEKFHIEALSGSYWDFTKTHPLERMRILKGKRDWENDSYEK